ncbi:MAG TPA: CsbD family protein [Pyrinomonadaceae bacterium]|nr:CsbD family protein [Pyrinomonadaceae bacterium]
MINEGQGTVREEASAVGDRIEGNVKDAYGSVTGNEAIEREGEAQANYGKVRQGQNQMLTGLFNDRESAEKAYSSVRSRGYNDDDVNLLMADKTRDTWFSDNDGVETDLGNKALEGAGAGSAIGGTLGAIIAGIAAIGTNVFLPGLGLIVAGPLAAALAGAGAGGLTGGLVGALIGSGIPEDRAKLYDEGIRNGGVVMGVNPRTPEDAEYFENEWRNNRGEHIYR